jgi:hypothetical protein
VTNPHRKTLAALRLARKTIASTRRTIFDSHADQRPGHPREVSDPAALDWIAEQDRALVKLDEAINTTKELF